MTDTSQKHYFLVGIGGIGMQALVDVMLGMGYKITGSDIADFPAKSRLEAKGVKVLIGPQVSENVPADIDGLIYSSVIKRHFPGLDHPEVLKAKELNVPIYKRSEFIGKLAESKIGIAVSGTHGKTTTSVLITAILQAANLEPSALIGAEVKNIKGCGVYGAGEHLVIEACEYDRSFLDMKPKIAVLTNIEADHLDYYKDLTEIKAAFKQFIELVPANGLIVACGDDKNVLDILDSSKAKVVTFGFNENNDLRATNLNISNEKMTFKVGDMDITMNFPGKHLVLDALAAIAVAKHLNIDDKYIKQALLQFDGASRRFDVLGTKQDITFVDDYAHHPTEIKAMLESAKAYFKDRFIRVVFQPHQFSRTRFLLNDFANSFESANEVLVAPILPVRDTEADKQSISTADLVNKINEVSSNAKEMPSFEAITEYLNQNIKANDVILSMGAGKNSDWIHKYYDEFKKAI